MKKRYALVVDDVFVNRDILVEMLGSDFETLEAADGFEALEMLKLHSGEIAVMLLDIVMPGMDGLEVLKRMNGQGLTEKIPVLVITSENDDGLQVRCHELGVTDFIKKPFDRLTVINRVLNSAELFSYKTELEAKVEAQVSKLNEQARRLYLINSQIIEMLGNIIEARNLESGLHIKRVKDYTRILAEDIMERCPEYGLDPGRIEIIVSASALHDIGKIMVPDSVLLKPGRLTPEEFAEIKLHTTNGCLLLDRAKGIWDEEYMVECYSICRWHHEKWDGRGYPDGLSGNDIPISAQIVSLADVYDALVNERVYKKAFTPEKAYDMITGGECGAFSPALMAAFSACRGRLEELTAGSREKAAGRF
jgi:putative two-component system response regulator